LTNCRWVGYVSPTENCMQFAKCL